MKVRANAAPVRAAESLAGDVRHYLTQSPRQLPSRALYDTLGSALFDAITHLPWYPVTRAERRLIAAHRQALLGAAEWPERLVELGCGSGEKLAMLLGPPEAAASRSPRRINLVDVSASALSAAERLITQDRDVVVTTHEERYEEGLRSAARLRLPGETLAVLFLGSNIGNFDPPGAEAFLAEVRDALSAGDALIIGTDLVKPEVDLLLAYDDPLGVTAAFNKNLLVRLNREMGADFDVTAFDHRAVWNPGESRVEMHLVSRCIQDVAVPAAGLSIRFRAGEPIWTESSYKHTVDGVGAMLHRAGFTPARRFLDEEGRFLLSVARVAA